MQDNSNQIPSSLRHVLMPFIPSAAVLPLADLLDGHHLRLKVASDRVSKLGDFRPGRGGGPHQISVNGSLNPYEFLLVLLHEFAHLQVHEQYGTRIRPHGKEWKNTFGGLIRDFLDLGVFPPSLKALLYGYSLSVRAAGVADMKLAKALRAFDRNTGQMNWLFLDEVPEQGVFQARGGRLFRKEDTLRKRVRCLCLDSKKRYLIHSMAKVFPQKSNDHLTK